MGISTDYDIDSDRIGFRSNEIENVNLADRIDASTIEKVMQLEIPEIPNATQSLEGRVSPSLEDQLDNVDPAVLEEIFNDSNYIVRLQELIAKILAQYQQISEKDKDKIQKLEKEYKLATLSVADLERELGWSGLKVAAFSFAASLLPLVPGANDTDKMIANIFAKDVVPNIGNLFTSDLKARHTSGDKLSNMLLQKYQQLSGAEQSKANDKQQVSGVFDKALNNLATASRSN